MGSFSVGDLGDFGGFCDGFESPAAGSVVLDGEKGELVKAPARIGRGGGGGGGGGDAGVKAAMALKSHSEAEKRRRERINGHLATLRGLIPCSEKLDKAALLAEVISQVKKLKVNASEVSKGCTVPSDADEVQVEAKWIRMDSETFAIKASLCCDDRPEVLADLRQTLQTFQLKIIGAEMSTLSGRMKVIFLLASEGNSNDTERHLLAASIEQALKSVMDRAASAQDFLLRTSYLGKRRRILPFESSSSSS